MLTGISATWRALRQHHARRSAARKLSGLDDHMLKDMGISRSEIGDAVSGRAQRRGAFAD